MIPTDSQIAFELNPKASKTKNIKIMAAPYLMIPSNRVMTVFALLDFCMIFLNINRNNLDTIKTTTIKIMQCINVL